MPRASAKEVQRWISGVNKDVPIGTLSKRLRLQIEVALDQDCTCRRTLAAQERRAERLGLTHAEIDAARARRSFDVQTNAAIDFACAVASQDQVRTFAASVKASSLGMPMTQLDQIAALVFAYTLPQGPSDDTGQIGKSTDK